MFLVQNKNLKKGYFKVKVNYKLCQPQVGAKNECVGARNNGYS